eukprot:13891847-Alexandrium_andersonii.AAC.1
MSMWAVPEKKHHAHFLMRTHHADTGPLGANFDGISGTNTIGQHSGLVPSRPKTSNATMLNVLRCFPGCRPG